jgi:hypothetical protein
MGVRELHHFTSKTRAFNESCLSPDRATVAPRRSAVSTVFTMAPVGLPELGISEFEYPSIFADLESPQALKTL